MKHSKFHNLDADKIVAMIKSLSQRVDERFPDSGLNGVCAYLLEVSKATKERSMWVAQPIYKIRILSILLIVGFLELIILTVSYYVSGSGAGVIGVFDLVQVSEPGLNIIVLFGAGIYFLATLEIKIKRHKAMAYLHELRSIAHIIDMHQLSKDPERFLQSWEDAHAEQPSLNHFDLGRYLDFASEMLSGVSKLAALYIQQFDDQHVLAAVNEVEGLTNGLSAKIWQKLMILYSIDPEDQIKAYTKSPDSEKPS